MRGLGARRRQRRPWPRAARICALLTGVAVAVAVLGLPRLAPGALPVAPAASTAGTGTATDADSLAASSSGTSAPVTDTIGPAAATATDQSTSSTQALSLSTCLPLLVGKIVCENQQQGSPQSEWDLDSPDAGDPSLQGFATDISVNVGQTVSFKIKSTASAYRLDIYRLGYYGGDGARKVATVNPSAPYPQAQPACLNDVATGLIDCGNWAASASWAVPSSAVSGLYIVKLVRTDGQGASHIPFVVRDDSSHSDLTLQTSDSTWTAYNAYGGNSLYKGSPAGRAYKVSYNRPYQSRVSEVDGHNWIFAAEYPMIRFLEANGYDLTYTTDVDSARRGDLIKNHKVFISSGHDEYWSGEQRANVQAARDAGVDLAFFSANSIYWKTRWEPSIDGSSTNWRTIVCYKETKNSSPQDPQYPAQWTGTWRDPRYSPPSNGGRPENELQGTLYMVDPPTDFAMKIPAAFSKLRFWRNTAVASAAPGTTVTLADATLGYEFDTDPDNGFRPAGVFDLTAQTENVQHKLLDYGSQVGPGQVTHNMTLYRAASGALVFGAGTVQWAYGLDAVHDGPPSTASPAMQQATVNLFADMGAQPKSLISGLVSAAASLDALPPSVTVTSTAHGVVGQSYAVTGTATDVGGVVAGVEVSTDGGSSWHPAQIPAVAANVNWSYTYTPNAPGTFSLKVRASDDSARLSSPVTASLIVDPRTCPCTIFGNAVPANPADPDGGAIEVGVRVRSTINGTITGVRFYKGAGNTGTHTGTLWSNTGTALATGTFSNETATGWQTLTFAQPVAVQANTTYVASYYAPSGHYAGDGTYFTGKAAYTAPLLALPDGMDGANGVFRAGSSGFPTNTFNGTNYWVDVVFAGDTATDTAPPQVVSVSPLAGSSSLPLNTSLKVLFGKPFNPSSVAFTLKTSGGTSVAGTVSVNSAALSATFTPNAALAAGTAFTATITAADYQGHAISPAYAWTFATGATQPPPGTCPCTVWSDLQQPGTVTVNDPSALELGVKVRASQNGWITGIRFFKGPKNTGVHTGTLWSATGTQLATATFADESTTGWQQVTIDPPVQATAGTTYVASYHTSVGYYSATSGYFASGGTSYGPLTALGNGVDGPNGVFAPGNGGVFPAQSYNSSNYWVDVVFSTTQPAPTPPRVVSVSPANAGTGVALGVRPVITFDRSLDPASITFTLKAGATNVSGSAAYDDAARRVTFTPSAPLQFSTTYTASANASGVNGVALASPYTWTFTTGTPATCPCTLWPASTVPANPTSSDANPYELGVRFSSDVTSWVTGITFYKGTNNTGSHTGSLWSASGQLLTNGTFTNETATGWQTLTFGTPVQISANTTYVASYYAPNGGYASATGYFAANDWNATPLHAPASGAGGTNGVFRGGSAGFPTTTYNDSNYWVSPVIVTQEPVSTCPCTLFGTQVPANPSSPDTGAIELGVRFTSDVNGSVTGVRFYKGAANTGTHTGSLWSASGQLLATGTFTNETATGWQTLAFATPVAITAGTEYVASYHTTVGGYANNGGFFSSQYRAAPLTGLAGGNGVYLHGAGGFPTNSYNSTNYWVDVVVQTT
ncbi:DUF4082 domain-containing protein [Frankia sp. CiP1_Cm_nod2]|uniref:DUF4082 domain-containing protein n=1 Tax=Frankia sp. CiP1_Cm_nod2 TaxID=2897161 RepID=UPI0020244749